jgi:leucyl-tRNA synthetase
VSKDDFERFFKILAPFAPHLTEEIWSRAGNKKSIFLEKWPRAQEKWLTDREITLIVQINGKVRDKIEIEDFSGKRELIGADGKVHICKEYAKERALESVKVQKYIKGKTIKKIIFVPDKLINLVI